MLASKRARQLFKGAKPLIESDNREVVVALREIGRQGSESNNQRALAHFSPLVPNFFNQRIVGNSSNSWQGVLW